MVLIKDMPECEKPRERFLSVGASNLSNEELLSIIIGTGTRDRSVKDLALSILKSVESIKEFNDLSINKLKNIKGIGNVKAINIMASLELGKRVYSSNENRVVKQIKCNRDVYDYFNFKLKNKKQEYFYVLYLDTKKNIVGEKMLFKGTVNRTDAHPREIFKEAFKLSSSALICIHNHPTGDPNPSNKDIDFTNRLMKTGDIVGIQVLDHIIMGNNKYFSFFEEGEKYKK